MQRVVLNSDHYKSKFNTFKNVNLINMNIIIGDSRFEKLSIKKTNGINLSIGGETTNTLIKRIENYNFDDSINLFIGIGINDVLFSNSKEKIFANFNKLLTLIDNKTRKSKIFIFEILPINIDGFFYKKNSTNLLVSKLNDVLNSTQLKSLNNNTLKIISLEMFDNQKGELYNKYTYDGIHLNNIGNFHLDSILNN